MVKQLNPGLARLYAAANKRQYGYHQPVVVENLSRGQERALDILEQGVSDNQLHLLPKLAHASEPEILNLLARLGSAVRQTSSFHPEFTEKQVSERFSEILRIFTSSEQDPAEVMKNRKRQRVFTNEISKFGLTLARGLESTGVGLLLTDDNSRVSKFDCGSLGFSKSQIGFQRAIAARSLVSTGLQIQPHSRVSASFDRVDIAVLASTDVTNPSLYQPWLARDTPHIAVSFTEAGVEISHLVIPGLTPCLGCIEIGRAQQDPEWVSIATQLDYLDRDLSDATSLMFAASIVLSRVLARIDSGLIPNPNPMIKLSAHSGEVMQLEPAAVNCGCQSVSNSETGLSS